MKKLKIKNPHQVRTEFLTKEGWLKFKKLKKDLCCSECKMLYSDIKDDTIAMMSVLGKKNIHLCNDCGRRYINELGAIDITKQKKEKDKIKNELTLKIKDILSQMGLKDYKDSFYKDKSIEDLEKHLEEMEDELLEFKRIESIIIDDSPLEEYLVKEYGVIKDVKYLKDETQIEGYFKDCGYDLFDCGQGYSQNKAEQIINIGDKYYLVNIKAEIGSSKQDRGERLYWVEDIKSVTWKEIEKPLKKERFRFNISFDLTNDEVKHIKSFFKENNYIYEEN